MGEDDMDYQTALDYLYQFVQQTHANAAPHLNLVRTQALLGALGNPQQHFPSVVVAGTKGKGSTSAMLEAITRAAGLRVGLWTSPHLHTYRERIQVNRQPISADELVGRVAAIKPLVDQLAQAPHGAPSTFAIGFAIALRHFADQHVDLAVLEVGVGGRYDSANVVDRLLSVITSISYDHTDILGNTLTEIASDKAGILQTGVPGVTIEQHPEAMTAIVRVAHEVGAPLFVVRDTSRAGEAIDLAGLSSATMLDVSEHYHSPISTNLKGTFQRQNARLVIGAALQLRERGLPIDDMAIAQGLQSARWPARLEIVDGAPPVVIDGAHNGDSAERLVESLHELYPGRGIVCVFGASRNKDLGRMLVVLASEVQAWVLTRSSHPRAMADLQALCRQVVEYLPPGESTTVLVEQEPSDALERARALAGPAGLVCVTGSLFVAAAAREALGLAHERD
jgi:dihydrofolate synthase/folylpolyglutamate synthase